MMGMMGSSMVGSMAGSVIGHGIAKTMFGGSSDAPAEQQDQGNAQDQGYDQGGYAQASYAPEAGGGEQDPCGLFISQFRECLQQVEGDSGMAACKWNLDQLRDCRQQNGQVAEF